uniref:Uncharacterized protein n=2 Tax=Corvus TaxID=30420 RepID=A0A8C3ECC8_CORMO
EKLQLMGCWARSSRAFTPPQLPTGWTHSRNGRVGVMEVDHADSRAPSLLVDFTRDLCGTGDIKHKQQAESEGKEEEDMVPPHLIFMLWQASVLKRLMQWDHLEEAVRDVRNLLPCLPDVLVLVMIRPDSQEQLDQAVRALRRMQCVLDGALQLTVETAIYSPGQPGGVLEAKRAACRALREALNCHEGNPVTLLNTGVRDTKTCSGQSLRDGVDGSGCLYAGMGMDNVSEPSVCPFPSQMVLTLLAPKHKWQWKCCPV